MTDILRLFAPLLLWLASFSAVYGLHGLSCAHEWSKAPVSLAFVVAIALQAALLLVLKSGRHDTPCAPVRGAILSLGVIGLIAVIWTLLPIAVLPLCK